VKWDEVLEKFALDFLKRREEKEGFNVSEHSFYIHDPEIQYLSTLLTGYVTDFYYMKAVEVFQQGAILHKYIIQKDPEYHLDSIKIARSLASIKDQVIIGILTWTRHSDRKKYFDDLVDLLATFPPNQIVKKFINTKRKLKELFGGYGTFDKRLINAVYEKWKEQDKIEYYFAKYRRYIQQLINVTHIKVDPIEFSFLSNPTKYNGNSEYLRRISEFLRTKDISVLPDKAPFELVRSNIKKSDWTIEVLEKCDITGNTVVLQACSLYEQFGENILPYIKRVTNTRTVTADKILKALLMSAIKGYNILSEELAKGYIAKVKDTYKQLMLPLPDYPRIALVVDASGSMYPTRLNGYFMKTISSVAPFAPLVKSLIMFSCNANYEDERLLRTWDGLLELIDIAKRKYNGGTNIVDGLSLAYEQVKTGEIDTVILSTDEQANIVSSKYGYRETEMELIRKMLNEGAKVIVLNPTPYPVHVTDISEKRLIYIPAANPEGVVSALKLVQLRKELQNATAKEVIAKIKVKLNVN